jgi:hypothetical protein
MTTTDTDHPRDEALKMRARILELPDIHQAELRTRFPIGVSLLNPRITDGQLEQIETLVAGYEARATVVPAAEFKADPEAIRRIQDLVRPLPPDLKTLLHEQMGAAGISEKPADVTPDQLTQMQLLLGPHIDTAERRRVHIMAAATEAGLDEGRRHALISEATGGRTESSKALTAAEVIDVLDRIARIDLLDDQAPNAVDWKTEAARLGTSQAGLLRKAQAAAKELGIDPPKKLTDIPACGGIHQLLVGAAQATRPAAVEADRSAGDGNPVGTAPVPAGDIDDLELLTGIVKELHDGLHDITVLLGQVLDQIVKSA